MKKILIKSIGFPWLCLLFLSLSPAGEIIGHWNFNSIDEDRVSDSTKKYKALLKGNAADLLQQGLYGTAYRFEGGTRIWVDHNDNLSLENDFSIEVVIKPFKTEGFNTILCKLDRKANPDEINYFIDIRSGKPEFKAKDDKDNWYVWSTKGSVIEVNKWYKIIFTFSDGKVRIIINGQEQEVVQSEKEGLQKLIKNKHKLLIGDGENGAGSSEYGFSGLIDEVKIIRGSEVSITPEDRLDILLCTIKMNFYTLSVMNESAIKKFTAYYPDFIKSIFQLKNINISEIENLNKDTRELAEFLKTAIEGEKMNNEAMFMVLGKKIKNSRYGEISSAQYPSEILLRIKETGHKTAAETENRLAEIHSLYSLLKNINTRAFRLAELLAAEYCPGSDAGINHDELYRKLMQHNEMLEEIAEKEKYFNNRIFAAIEKISADARYASLFTGNEKFILTVLPVYKRLFKKTSFLAELDKVSGSMNLSMAKNEYESFQVIIIGNPAENSAGIQISVRDLMHSSKNYVIKGSNIDRGLVEYVRTEEPVYKPVFTGLIPDPIFEPCRIVNVNSNDFTALHFRIYAPSDAAPGVYSGSIRFSLGSFSREIKITAAVFDFTLPKKNSIKAAFSFFEQFYQKWYGYKELTDDQKMYIYDFLLKYRIPPNNIYAKDIYPEPKFIPELRKKGLDFITIGSLTDLKGEPEAIASRFAERQKKLQELGVWDDVYCYTWDEFASHTMNRDLAFVEKVMAVMKKEYTGMRYIQTSFPLEQIKDLFNVWCPHFNFFTTDFEHLEKMKNEKGCEIWWYNACGPEPPYPQYFIDLPLTGPRIIWTLSFKYGVKGLLYWCINREWVLNREKNPEWPHKGDWLPYFVSVLSGEKSQRNGCGNLVYPGPNGAIYPSLRLENLRDGIEDYEYLSLLQIEYNRLKAKGTDKAVLDKISYLLAIPQKVAVSVNNYTDHPEEIVKFRNEIAEMILEAKKY